MVKCAKLGEELAWPSLQAFQRRAGPANLRFDLAQAWTQWIEHTKKLVNEYRLDLTQKKAHEVLKEQCEAFLFGDGGTRRPSTSPKSIEPMDVHVHATRARVRRRARECRI